ncbi:MULTISPECIES: SIS domain-containing protein [unclassified Mesorhizobium]|uniref:SIS domain-containing protein n=1 Tax=unclassified Mesorhizobium TaxID=325217 RepID=UPI000FD48F30|nr:MULTISPECIES: SIS domain-containing protein [unclassified Mesorhizobium]RVB80586.1 SIS domain-containing protein [Mesorhizobium sp. M6A.T.Cr.TU.014.01.1.1]RWQ06441.1 MAG: SIS domain-containing protein [Mesorhizobium sp.]RWQ10828.1 MAG: SIS domain-containing protein [Mesorhizobium sp.]
MTAEQTDTQIANALNAVAARENVTDIFFVACGGSYAQMLPNQYIVECEAKAIIGNALNAAEFKARAPKRLGKSSIVITLSHSGTTPETVEAVKIARAAGALTISLTHDLGSPLDQASEFTVSYFFSPMTMSPIHAAAVLARLTFGILKAREGNTKVDDLDKGLAALPALVDKLISQHLGKIAEFAEAHKREAIIYTMASGPNFGPAYSFAICLLQEMQWVHSAAIHAGEYFHGPFEITDFDVPFIQLLGVGPSRPMDERALAFVQKYSKRVTVLDAKDLGVTSLPGTVSEYLAPLVFSPVLRVYADKLSEAKGHPLTVRRFMWKMEY